MIKATYLEMQTAANRISDAAGEYKANIESLYKVIDNLSNDWKGEDNVRYVNAVNDYKDYLAALGDVVNDYAKFLVKSANLISATQDEISQGASRI